MGFDQRPIAGEGYVSVINEGSEASTTALSSFVVPNTSRINRVSITRSIIFMPQTRKKIWLNKYTGKLDRTPIANEPATTVLLKRVQATHCISIHDENVDCMELIESSDKPIRSDNPSSDGLIIDIRIAARIPQSRLPRLTRKTRVISQGITESFGIIPITAPNAIPSASSCGELMADIWFWLRWCILANPGDHEKTMRTYAKHVASTDNYQNRFSMSIRLRGCLQLILEQNRWTALGVSPDEKQDAAIFAG